MSRTNPLAERERALEDLFFRKENERLVEAMRARKTREAQYEALSGALGVKSPELIDPLLDLGVREENVTALVLAPLIALAWSDHELHDDERRAILKAEHDFAIEPESDAGQLLAHWLDHRPHESLLDAWAAYVRELCGVLPAAERDRLRDDVLQRAQDILDTFENSLQRGGGPSEAEKQAMAKIEAAFG
jgi:hypothetical protein